MTPDIKRWILLHRTHLNTVGKVAFTAHPWGNAAFPHRWRVNCYCGQSLNVPSKTQADEACDLAEGHASEQGRLAL